MELPETQLDIAIVLPANEARALVANALTLAFFRDEAKPEDRKTIEEIAEIAFQAVLSLGIPTNDIDKFQVMEYIMKEAMKE